jgi:phosphoribosylanthranilate isomerase
MVPSAPLGGQLPEMAGTAPRLGMDAASRRTRIKICGCTTAGEVALAVAAGADAVGVIFAPSPRQISIEQAARALAEVPKQLSLVGVFVDPSTAELERAITAMPRLIPQFSGSESPALCRHLGRPFLKVFRIPAGATELALGLAARIADYPDALPIFETASSRGGGSGRTFDWSQVEPLSARQRVVISGGLNPGNVAACVSRLRPYAVDVRSGVESRGVKDPSKLAAFVSAVRRFDATT